MISESVPPPYRISNSAESFIAFCRWFSAFVVLAAHARALSFVGFDQLHAGLSKKLLTPFYMVSALYAEAVIVFFVLSGFLVGGRALERAMAGRFSTRDYTIDRATRIYCVLIPALLLTLLLDTIGSNWFHQPGLYDGTSHLVSTRFPSFDGSRGFDTLACNLLAMQPHRCPVFGSNVPLWSLSYEIWFYVCAGAICTFVSHRSIVAAVLSVLAIVAMVLALGWSAPVYGCFWLAGAMVYLISRKPPRVSRLFVIAANLSAIVGIPLFNRYLGGFELAGWKYTGSMFATAALFAGLLYLHANAKLPSSERLRSINLAFSDFSYSLYIIHFPIVMLTLSVLIVGSGGLVGARSGFLPTSPWVAGAYLFALLVAVLSSWVFSKIFEKGSWKVRRWLKAMLADPGAIKWLRPAS